MKALVTGGTGFVGSHVVRELTAQGWAVRVLHRESSKRDALDGLTFESALGGLGDLDALRRACEGCDRVFHIAAVADYWRADHSAMFEANVKGTANVLQAARETGVSRVVFTSSAAAVGITSDGTPADESLAFNLTPQQMPYGYSKVLAEQVVADAVRGGQHVVTVNPVVVLGPGDLNQISGSLVIEAAQRGRWMPVPGGGVAVVDVRDVARWHVAAAERGRSGERYLLGTENLTHAQLFARIAAAAGTPRPVLHLPDFAAQLASTGVSLGQRLGLRLPVDALQIKLSTRLIYFDFSKAWSELGPPQVSIRDSIRDAYAWYAERGLI
jgi:dihydroflavonol-4-reductase